MLIYLDAYMELNLGDDLFIKTICERYPQVEFQIILSSNYKNSSLSKINNLKIKYISPFISKVSKIIYKIFPSINYLKMIEKNYIRRSKAVVTIGGSLFIEDSSWKENIKRLKENVECSTNYFIIGSNFGPYKTEVYFDTYCKLFSNLTDICFRDIYSYELFNSKINCRYAPDIIFSMRNDNIVIHKTTPYIVISPIDLTLKKKIEVQLDKYEYILSEVSKILIAKGFKIVLMGFCESENDHKAIQRISNLISSIHCSSYLYKGDLEEALSIIKSADGIIATRFHSLILSLLYNISVYPIAYSNKTINFLNDIDFKGDYLDLENLKKSNRKIINSIQCQLLDNKIDVNIEALKKESQNQFQKLDIFLGEKDESI
ncbi:polysaccharide pyruvyl transferase family protein [Aerococcus urinae]